MGVVKRILVVVGSAWILGIVAGLGTWGWTGNSEARYPTEVMTIFFFVGVVFGIYEWAREKNERLPEVTLLGYLTMIAIGFGLEVLLSTKPAAKLSVVKPRTAQEASATHTVPAAAHAPGLYDGIVGPTTRQQEAIEHRFMAKVEQVRLDAIEIAKRTYPASELQARYPHYLWKSESVLLDCSTVYEATLEGVLENLHSSNPYMDLARCAARGGWSAADQKPNPVRLVCYCNERNNGFRWEVHTDIGRAYFVDDNADLRKKYGLVKPK